MTAAVKLRRAAAPELCRGFAQENLCRPQTLLRPVAQMPYLDLGIFSLHGPFPNLNSAERREVAPGG